MDSYGPYAHFDFTKIPLIPRGEDFPLHAPSPVVYGTAAVRLHRQHVEEALRGSEERRRALEAAAAAAAAAEAAAAVVARMEGSKKPRLDQRPPSPPLGEKGARSSPGGSLRTLALPVRLVVAGSTGGAGSALSGGGGAADCPPPCIIPGPVFCTSLARKMPTYAFFPREKKPLAAPCPNAGVVEMLQALLKVAREGFEPGDTFRVRNYPTAIGTVERLGEVLHEGNVDRLLGKRPGCGAQTLVKIKEYLTTGNCAKLLNQQLSAEQRTISELTRIWGVGHVTACKLVREHNVTGLGDPLLPTLLSEDARYCLSIMQDLETRIPRAEAQEILEFVQRRVELMRGGAHRGRFSLTICGSYRRGVKKDCGDVDIIITPRGEHDEALGVLDLVEDLLEAKFVTWLLKTGQDRWDSRGRVGAGEEEEEEEGASEGREGFVGYNSDSEGGEEGEGGAGAAGSRGGGVAEGAAAPCLPPEILQAVVESHRDHPGALYSSAVSPPTPWRLLPHDVEHYKRLHSSAMTVVRLPGAGRLHRRLDLKFYPRATFPFALLYFTGSDYFNRSLRNFCNKCGWTLSDHGLCKVHKRNYEVRNGKLDRSVLEQGHSIRCANEADVLRAIGAPWVPPCQREV